MKLSLGPIHYFWPAETVRRFYREVEHWPVDIVYLGETVCAKRRELGLEDWLAIAARLHAAGKEVVLSTLGLLEAGSELGMLERICANGRHAVEANDMAAVQLLADAEPFVVGPHVNTYNGATLTLLARLGARRWVPPVELPAAVVRDLQAARPAGMETEVLAYGRLPLAVSARCFTARAHDLPKDRCELRCIEYPDGLPLHTQEDCELFTVNGVQLQSAGAVNLLGHLDELKEMEVDVLRISPRLADTGRVVRTFHEALLGLQPPAAAAGSLACLVPEGWCNGYWHGEAGMVKVSSQ